MAQSTKQSLSASLGKLLKRKSLDDITVKEIVESCGVNRQTFYYHFQDIHDLLRWHLEDEVETLLADCVSWQDALLRAYLYTRDNHITVYHIFRSAGREHMDCHFYALGRKISSLIFHDECEGLALPDADQEFLLDFFMYALAGMMIGWVADGMKDEPADLVSRVGRLLDGEFRRIAEKLSRRP